MVGLRVHQAGSAAAYKYVNMHVCGSYDTAACGDTVNKTTLPRWQRLALRAMLGFGNIVLLLVASRHLIRNMYLGCHGFVTYPHAVCIGCGACRMFWLPRIGWVGLAVVWSVGACLGWCFGLVQAPSVLLMLVFNHGHGLDFNGGI